MVRAWWISPLAGMSVGLALAQPPGQPPAATPPPSPPAASPGTPPTSPGQPPKYPTEVGGKTLTEWLKELTTSKDGQIREMAVKALPAFGPAAREPSLGPLAKIVREDNDPGVRVNAILTLGAIGANNKEEARQICEALRLAIMNSGIGSIVRLHATRALVNYAHYPEQASSAIPALATIISDPAWETRKTVAYTLGRIGVATKPPPTDPPKPPIPGVPSPPVDPKTGPDKQAIKLLTQMMSDASETVRLEAIEALVALGPPAVPLDQYAAAVEPIMLAAQKQFRVEKERSVLVWLYMLNMRLDGNQFNDQTIGRIVELARGGDSDATIQAMTALSILGEKAFPAGLMLAKESLKHKEPLVAAAAVGFLGNAGVKAKDALPDLEQLKLATKDEILKDMTANVIEVVSGRKMPPKMEPPKKN